MQQRQARAGIPALQVLRQVASTARFPFAGPDYETGSRLAAEHLVALGARRIAFIGGLEGRAVTQSRMSGYLAAMAGAPLVLPGRPTRAFGRDAAALLVRDHPEVDAVICFNDLVALGLLAGCAEIGRVVGPGFRVVGFDDIEECAHAFPPLTSIRCNVAAFGRSMAETVFSWIETGVPPPPETLTPVSLVPRASSLGP